MATYLGEFLRTNPVGLLFAVLGLGYLVGKTKIRGFEIGSITGVLFVGLVFGHYGFSLNPMVQTLGFVLFIVYLLLYGGFVFLNAFAAEIMEMTPIAGVNLAILYGFGLIIGALLLALVYGLLCQEEAAEREAEK